MWLERISLGRLCWLYCGPLGSVFFFSFLLECVSSLSFLSLGRLRWLHYGFLGL